MCIYKFTTAQKNSKHTWNMQNIYNQKHFIICLIIRADYHAKLWLSQSLSEISLSWYYHNQGSNIRMHHDTITISKSHSMLMNFVDFIKTWIPVKIPNITALSNISFPTILTLVLLNPDIPSLCKQCRSRLVGANWSGSALFVIEYLNLY